LSYQSLWVRIFEQKEIEEIQADLTSAQAAADRLYGGQSRESLVTDFLNHLQIAKRKIENLERQVTDGSGSK
jgi:hypothetical protein